jgi:uncharacterized protein YvpB
LPPPPPPGPVKPLDPASNFQTIAGNGTNETFLLNVPYRSQYDASPYQNANCGPASLAMVLLAYGLDVPNDRLRSIADSLQGTSGYNDGIALQYLQVIAKQAGLNSEGLFDLNGHYHQWSMGDVIREVRRGYPVITLVHFASLPAHATSGSTSDHYIVVVGVTSNGFIINDPASDQSQGFQQILQPQDLLQAWHDASVPNQAIAFLPPKGAGGLQALHAPGVPTDVPVVPVVSAAPVAAAGVAAPSPTLGPIQAGVSLPPPNPAMVDLSSRVGGWLRPSPLPTIQANASANPSSTDGSIVLAEQGTSSSSPLPLLLILGCLAAVAGGVLSMPSPAYERGPLQAKRRSKQLTVRDPRTVNRLAFREPRQLPPLR